MALEHLNRLIDPRDDVRPTEPACIKPVLGRPHSTRGFMIAFVAIMGLVFGPTARAGGLVLDFASAPGAHFEIKGSGSGATFQFDDNATGQGLVVTGSDGVGDSVGLHGTVGGTFSYSAASITTSGVVQTAPITGNGGTLTITDNDQHALTAVITGTNVTIAGTAGLTNLGGAVNLTSVSYSGTNADLMEFRNEAATGGGILTVSFQFTVPQSLTALAAGGADNTTSFSGSIAAVPEPSGLILLALGALASLGYGARRRKVPGARPR